MRVDLNADVGEVSSEVDHAILKHVTSCNVCCNAHAGSEELIADTIKTAIQLGVSIGAHPSWPDRENFGRQSMDLPLSEFRKTIRDQVLFVERIARINGGEMRHVKPHGALYHDCCTDRSLAESFVSIIRSIDENVIIFGMSGSELGTVCEDMGVQFIHEAFADRKYDNANSLVSRSNENAIISNADNFQNQIIYLTSQKIIDVHGDEHQLKVDSICIHSDSPNASEFAVLAHQTLKEQNVTIKAP